MLLSTENKIRNIIIIIYYYILAVPTVLRVALMLQCCVRPSVVVVCNVTYYHMAMAMAIWLYGIWLALWLNGASCSKSYTIDSLQEVIY